jgi:prepilin-type N-terminal cleavage/methylation domain-containing protein
MRDKTQKEKMMKQKKQGFTLVEIMIVVLIIGLLAAIAIPSFVRARDRSRDSACVNNLRQIDSAKEQFAMENNVAEDGTVTTGEAGGLIKAGWPSCPGGGTYTIGVVGTDPSCNLGGNHTI